MKDIMNLYHRAEQSNPFSTGGGGTNFEISVQTYFTGCMLMGWKVPGLRDNQITKIKLQGRYVGYDVDDCIVYGESGAKLLCQIKHSITITKNDNVFKEVIAAAWNDFINKELFNRETDRIALVVAGLSATDIQNTRTIFEWARTCENEKEFLDKLYTPGFSSKEKQNKYEAIKYHLEIASDRNIDDELIWCFMRKFFILNLELDVANSSLNEAINSGLEKFCGESNFGMKIYHYVANMNQNAGTVLLENIIKDLDIKNDFVSILSLNDHEKIKSHNDLIFSNIRNDIAGVSISRAHEVTELQERLEDNDVLLITGERGVGKSGVIKEFKEKLGEDKYCLMFRAEELNEAHFQNVLNDMGLSSTIDELNQSLSLFENKYLFIESLERLLEYDNTRAFCDLLLLVTKQKGWKIIATVRNYAVQQVIMNFISTYFVKYAVIEIHKFSKKEIEDLIEKIDILKSIKSNPELLDLIQNPFYLECLYKTLYGGYVVTARDTKNSIKTAIWSTIVEKNYERIDGLPKKRSICFTQIAINRAKTMKYAIDEDEFNDEALLKLEEDGLIIRKDGLVCLSHDVFEDWALERFIEKKFKDNAGGSFRTFFENIGCEQSICRAYRLWLDDKFEDDNFAKNYIQVFFSEKDIRNIWYDETLVAVIYSRKMDSVLSILRPLLFEEECKLLKRVCFVIRVSAKRPDMELANFIKEEKGTKWASLVSLKPYGDCWRQIIEFLYVERENLPADMYIHCSYILDEWSRLLNIYDEMPESANKAGLLALFIVDKIKDDYSSKKLMEKLFLVAMMTYKSISKEFTDFINDSVFNDEKRDRYCYIDDLAKQIYSGMYCGFIAKYAPDLLIRVAKREWLLHEQPDNNRKRMMYMYSSINKEEKYGLNESAVHDYFPATGEREPFRSLFRFFPKKAVDFVIEICNISADAYINSQIKLHKNKEEAKDSIRCELKKSDGSIVKQYLLGDSWGAYRGMGNAPYLLQSALMALENWLLLHFEKFKDNNDELDYCIDYLISNSNSVFITAVVASVVVPYYRNVGGNVLLLLQNNDFYSMDMSRRIREMGDKELSWFATYDPLRNLYIAERKKAATREWRKESLEDLCIKLQFTSLREKILDLLDEMNQTYATDVDWRFRIHRLDTREFSMEYDEQKSGIICKSGEIQDEDLLLISKESSEKSQRMNRFMSIAVWADNAIKNKAEFDTYKTPQDVYQEIRELLKISNTVPSDEKMLLADGSIIKAISVLYRDFQNKLSKDEVEWCRNLLIKEFLAYDKSLKNIIENGKIDNTGMWSVAEILPLFAESLSEKQLIELLTIGLTSCDLDVRFQTAKGIKKYLWKVNESVADKCIKISMYFCVQYYKKRRCIHVMYYSKGNKEKEDYLKWLSKERRKINKTGNYENLLVQEEDIPLTGITLRMLMLCTQYNDKYKKYVSEAILRMSIAEKELNDHRNDDRGKIDRYYNVLEYNTNAIGEYLFELKPEDLSYYHNALEQACEDAPSFMKWVMLTYDLLAEQTGNKMRYWSFWNLLSSKMQDIAKQLCLGENYKYDKRNEILQKFMYVNTSWQPIDYKTQTIKDGVESICEFTSKTVGNPIVFEGISSLMYHFPNLILEKGLIAIEKLSLDDIISNFKKSNNSIFYFENILHVYIINMESKTMPVRTYDICEKLLNSLVEMASSKAYYIREYLIKSKRIA